MKSINDIKLTIKAPLVIVGLVLSTAAMMYFFGHSIAVLGGRRHRLRSQLSYCA